MGSLYRRGIYSETKLFIRQYMVICKVLVLSNVYCCYENLRKEVSSDIGL
jgi:hypothetical protein